MAVRSVGCKLEGQWGCSRVSGVANRVSGVANRVSGVANRVSGVADGEGIGRAGSEGRCK